jgi:tetratricopeptide (TPR) repeat protein
VENSIKWQGEIAATYHGAKKYQEAINVYEGLMAEDIEHAEKWRLKTASAYQSWGKYAEAIGHYRQCTNFPTNYKQMAWCNRQLKKYQEAIILYNQVMAHEPSAPEALYEIGKTYEDAQKSEQAIRTFQLVCKRFPKNSYASIAHARLQDRYKISVTLGGAKDESHHGNPTRQFCCCANS